VGACCATDRQIQGRIGQFQQPGAAFGVARLIGTTSRDAIAVSGDATSD
jgi:hypothetical protein